MEKVAEIKSIKEYNQWVMRNKTRYPTLMPIRISSEVITWGEEYKIYYYNANGDVFKEEILKAKPGIWLSIEVCPYEGRVLTFEGPRSHEAEGAPSVVTAKDSQGNITCSFISRGAGLFSIPSIGFFTNNINKGKVEIINWNGDKIAEFPSKADYYEFGRMEYINTPDHKYVLLSFMMGSPHVALWEENEGTYRELWQKNYSSAVEISISNDGQYSCVGDSGCVLVYNYKGNLVYSYCFPKRGRTNPVSDFSPDGKFLVCALSSQMALIDNKTGTPIWEISVPGDEFVRQVLFVKNGEYIVLTHISVKMAYLYDLKGALQATVDNVYGCSGVDDIIICGSEEDQYRKTVYQIGKE